MKECKKVHVHSHENRKAWLERHNTMIKDRMTTPESSLLSSGAFSNEISLNSLSLRTEGPGTAAGTQSRDRSERIHSGKTSLATGQIPKFMLLDYDHPSISEEDKKILKLMAWRREAAIEEEEMAFSARNIWAEDQKLHKECIQEKKKSWNEYIIQKRKMEQIENCRRKKNQQQALKTEKLLLESKINEKHERVERRQKELSVQKKQRPTSNTEYDKLLHQQLKEQRDREEELQNALHIKLYEARERRTEEKHRNILLEKYRRIKEASLKRELKWQAAKDTREELSKKQEEIQEQNLKRYQSSQLLSEYRVNWALEWKKKLLLEKNRMKKQHHSFIINKLKEEDRERETQARIELQKKDAKLKHLHDRREIAITRSQMNARTAANLRQQIKSSYTL